MRSSLLMCAFLASVAVAGRAGGQARLRRPHPDSVSAALLVPLDSIQWNPRNPSPGQSQIAIIHIEPKTNATQLYFRLPPGVHAPRHWHSANETNVVIRGTFVIQHDGGERVRMTRGDFNLMPGRMVHQAWTEAEETIVFVSLDGRWDYHAVPDSVKVIPQPTP